MIKKLQKYKYIDKHVDSPKYLTINLKNYAQ